MILIRKFCKTLNQDIIFQKSQNCRKCPSSVCYETIEQLAGQSSFTMEKLKRVTSKNRIERPQMRGVLSVGRTGGRTGGRTDPRFCDA